MSDYDEIGRGYLATRRPDPRIASALRSALGDVNSVVNIGAGSGAYEPADLDVVAVEPSPVMIDQRPAGTARAVMGVAEALPLDDKSVDAALAVLTVHHWTDLDLAWSEIRRVVRRRAVFLTVDPAAPPFWLTRDYLPEIRQLDALRVPPLSVFERLGAVEVRPLPVAHDCTDGFLAAFWRRPAAYLDPDVQANISAFVASNRTRDSAGSTRSAETSPRGLGPQSTVSSPAGRRSTPATESSSAIFSHDPRSANPQPRATLRGMQPRFFAGPEEFRAWLETNHATESEVVVGFYKKHTGRRAMTWTEAVREALCFGWIDGLTRRIDDDSYGIRFTPRRPRSNWSAVNVRHVEELLRGGRMHPAGLAAFEARAPEKTGVYTYENRHAAKLSPEQEQQFRANERAWEFFQAQPPGYRQTAVFWVVSAKREETRSRRLATLIADSANRRRIALLRPSERRSE